MLGAGGRAAVGMGEWKVGWRGKRKWGGLVESFGVGMGLGWGCCGVGWGRGGKRVAMGFQIVIIYNLSLVKSIFY